MRIKILFLAITITFSCLIKAQEGDRESNYYTQVLDYLKGESSFGIPENRYSKLKVSTQIVDFDVLGWFLQSELSKRISDYKPKSKFSDDDFRYEESLRNLTDDFKKSKCQIFFSKMKGNILLAEVIKESKSSDYRTAVRFGEGTVFLFEFNDGKLENVVSKNAYHN